MLQKGYGGGPSLLKGFSLNKVYFTYLLPQQALVGENLFSCQYRSYFIFLGFTHFKIPLKFEIIFSL